MYKVVHFLIVCLYLDSEKVYSIFLEKNYPCPFDGTANMAAPYCVHLDNFVNFTSVLGYFILNSHVRIGIYHSKTIQTQNFSPGGIVKALRPSYFDNATHAKILRLDVFE